MERDADLRERGDRERDAVGREGACAVAGELVGGGVVFGGLGILDHAALELGQREVVGTREASGRMEVGACEELVAKGGGAVGGGHVFTVRRGWAVARGIGGRCGSVRMDLGIEQSLVGQSLAVLVCEA